jgi:single-stranded DNA-binding protein
MRSEIYLTGRLAGDPEISQTKKGKPWIKLLVETERVSSDGRGGLETVWTILPVSCFSGEAQAAKDLQRGDSVTVACHLSGTSFAPAEGSVKYGVSIIADQIFINSRGGKG